MLQRVTLGQVRFNLPGLTVDARGVVGGRQLAVRFGAIDRLVSFLRLLSAEQSLDDLQGGLRIMHARSMGVEGSGTRETIVLMPSASTQLADAVARSARAAGGQCFTGSGKHFVQLRDRRSPLGYDAAGVSHDDAAALVLYAWERAMSYAVESELPLQKLLLRLSLQRRQAGGDDGRDLLYLTVRRGLCPTLAAYLRRSSVQAGAALCETTGDSAFRPESGFWLFRLERVPPRMMGLLSGTPGLELFRPVTPNVAVAAGHRHPIHLESCKGAFPADRFFLFSAAASPATGATIIGPAPVFLPVEDLVRIESPLPADARSDTAKPAQAKAIVVPIRLEATPEGGRRALACLVPWRQVRWLRRLCYALPPSALRGYRIALLERGALVVAPAVLDGLPFGALLDAAAPGVYVPVGTRLRPAVSPDLLATRVGATGGTIVVFPAIGEEPFRIPADRIEPLERRTLAEIDLKEAEKAAGVRRHRGVEPPKAIEIENVALGPMPLWGIGK